jgi:hypothetical protein
MRRWCVRFLLLAAAAALAAAAQARPDDREIEQNIRARFAKSKISRNQFTVRVQGGVATLEGRTDVVQHKGVATRLAKLGGARQVVNKIEVSEAARQKASANLAKGRRRAQVKRAEPRSERK